METNSLHNKNIGIDEGDYEVLRDIDSKYYEYTSETLDDLVYKLDKNYKEIKITLNEHGKYDVSYKD